MKKLKRKIRYKYREEKEGFLLDNLKCPVCKSIHKNFIKVVQDKSWNGTIVLLVECWTGNTTNPNPQHLYLIELEDLHIVNANRVRIKK